MHDRSAPPHGHPVRTAGRAPLVVAALGLALGATLGGCAKPPPPDDSPFVRSATIVSKVTNGGLKGQFATAGTRTERTVADMRRVDDASRFTGSVMGRIGGEREVSEILRLDRDVLWRLDHRAETWQECPLEGCPSYLERLGAGEQTFEEDEELEGCTVELAESELSMAPTGERRTVNGFDALQHRFLWRTVHADPDGRRTRNELTSEVWTTEPEGELAEAIAMEAAFDANYRRALGDTYPRNLVLAFPREALEAVQKYLIETLPEPEAERLYARLRALEPIEGFPVSRSIRWQATGGGSCAAPPEPDEGDEDALDTGSVGGLLASIGKTLLKQEAEKKREEKVRELALEPVLSYVETVESVTVEDVRESALRVPADYALVERR